MTATKDVFKDEHYYKYFKIIACAKTWEDPAGKKHNIVANLKVVYHHRLDQYNSYMSEGKPYYETNEQVSEATGVSLSNVQNKINPLLIRMGLLNFERVKAPNKYNVEVRTVDKVKGVFINPKLKKRKTNNIDTLARTPEEWVNYQVRTNKRELLRDSIVLLEKEYKELGVDMFTPIKHKVKFSME